jgi:hypothetical protein
MRTLNHVELVYRPGERDLAIRFFELLGCRPVDRGGTFFSALVEPTVPDFVNNVLYASEVTPEQWQLDRTLIAAIDGEGEVGAAAQVYLERLRREPQRSFHFGVRYPDLPALEATVDGIRGAGDADADLAGRVSVSGVFHPGDPGAYTDTMVQAFVKTDVVAAGLLALGQHIELQWHLPHPG